MIDIDGIVKNVMDIAGDLAGVKSSVTFRVVDNPQFNETAGTTTGTNTDTVCDCIFTEFSAKEIDGDKIRQGDKRAMIRAAQLAAVLDKISVSNKILEGVQVWNLVAYTLDATKTIFFFHVRGGAQ